MPVDCMQYWNSYGPCSPHFFLPGTRLCTLMLIWRRQAHKAWVDVGLHITTAAMELHRLTHLHIIYIYLYYIHDSDSDSYDMIWYEWVWVSHESWPGPWQYAVWAVGVRPSSVNLNLVKARLQSWSCFHRTAPSVHLQEVKDVGSPVEICWPRQSMEPGISVDGCGERGVNPFDCVWSLVTIYVVTND